MPLTKSDKSAIKEIVREETSDLRKDFSGQRKDLSSLRSDVSDLQEGFIDLQSEVRGLREEISANNDKIDLLPTKEEFFSKMDEAVGELMTVRQEQEALAHRSRDHENRIIALEKLSPQ